MESQKKWLARRMETLDPHVDYVEIWRLSSSYGHNEFMSQLAYTLTFQNFIVTQWGSEAVWRDDGGKVLDRAYSRVDQTTAANYIWWFYGPHDERTKKSVDAINKLHVYWAKRLPGRFSYNDDYIYTCAYTAISVHRMRLSLGLPGISDKEKIASHRFWREMSKLFLAENATPLHGYPEDFDGLTAFCEDYEHEPRPKPERTHLIVAAFHEQFVMRFFPGELHWLGHQLVRSLSLPTTLKTAQIDLPMPMAKELLPKLLGFIASYQEQFGDDPEFSFLEMNQRLSAEEKQARRKEMRGLDKAFRPHFTATYGNDPRFAGCPYHAALIGAPDAAGQSPPGEIEAIERASAPHV